MKSDEIIRLGDFVFTPSTRTLRDQDGQLVQLRRQSAEVLFRLADRVGEPVSKDTLIEQVWGDTFVTDGSLVQCIADIRRALDDRDHTLVQTVPKVGYLLAPSHVTAEASSDTDLTRVSARRRLALPVAAILLCAIAALAVVGWPAQEPDFVPADPSEMSFELSETPSIALLPFEVISGGALADQVGFGISDSVLTTLARSPDLLVIANDASSVFTDTAVPAGEIAEELGVRYLLRGSVQLSGEQLRLAARLLDAVDGSFVWSEVFDRPLVDVFELQDDLSRSILNALQVELTFESSSEIQRLNNLDQYLTYLRWRSRSTQFTPEGNSEAFDIAEGFLAQHPESPVGHEMMGMNHYVRGLITPGQTDAEFASAREHFERAFELDPVGGNYQWLGWIDLRQGKYDAAIQNADRGLAVSPNDPIRLRSAGAIKALAGQLEEGAELLRRAVRRTPIGSEWVIFELAFALMQLGELQEAQEISEGLLEREVRDRRAHVEALRYLAAIAIWQDDAEGGKRYVDRLLELNPQEDIASALRLRQGKLDAGFMDKYSSALRRAGIPG